MGFNFNFTMPIEFKNMEAEIFIQVENFTPSRPAPICSNHDSPNYSDCGDDCEFDEYTAHLVYVLESGRMFFLEIPEGMLDFYFDKIIDEIFEHGENHYCDMQGEKEEHESKRLND